MLELPRPKSVFDLGPPVLPTFKCGEVLPEGKIFLFEVRTELVRKIRAVRARIGDEDPTRMIPARHRAFPVDSLSV